MEKQITVWELIEENRFEEACLLADLEYQKTKRIFNFRNKVKALFHLKRYQESGVTANIAPTGASVFHSCLTTEQTALARINILTFAPACRQTDSLTVRSRG